MALTSTVSVVIFEPCSILLPCVCFSSIVWVACFASSKFQLVLQHIVWSFWSLREDNVCYMFALGSIRLHASLALVLEKKLSLLDNACLDLSW